MFVDTIRWVRRSAGLLLLRAFGAGLVASAMLYGAAHAQPVDAPVPAGAHPVDWISALYGSGGTGAAVAVVVAVLWVLNRAGVPVGITVGKKAPTVDDEASAKVRAENNLERRVDQIETEQARLSEAQKHIAGNQTRTLLEVKEVRDLAQQILLRQMGKGGGRG